MKLFFYYAFHSVKNQIRKLCKTWFIGVLVGCMLLGGIVGFVAVRVENNLASEIQDTEILPTDDITIEELDPETIVTEEIFGQKELTRAYKLEIAEVVCVGVILGLFALILMNLEKYGLAIFQPADISILFASPMSPQSVVMFRSFCSMGMYAFMTIYFMIEIPALKELLEIDNLGAASIILAFGILLTLASFIKIYLSILISNSEKVRKYWTYVLYAVVGVLALSFVIYWKQSGLEIIDAAIAFFNNDISRYIPLVGWIKGIVFFGIEGNIGMWIAEIALSIAAIALVLVLIKNSKPDFYEEAIHKSEEVAQLALKMKEKNSIFIKGKKSEKEIKKEENIRKDGLNKGHGAIMFFIKPMYNRFRFVKFGIFTKTLITYTLVSLIAGVIAMITDSELPMIIPAFIICAMVFYRSLGNPLREDIDSIYFHMAPDKAWKKLLSSLLAGAVNCLLDILPGIVIAGILSGSDISTVLGYIAFIITMDLFSTCAGTFVHVSLPQNAGANAKQSLQILFIYFGILPDIILIALMLSAGYSIATVIFLASILNIVLGSIFFGLIIPYVETRGGECRFEGRKDLDLRKVSKDFSRVGLALSVFFGLTYLLQYGIFTWIYKMDYEITYGSLLYFFVSMGPMYLIAFPITLLILKKLPEIRLEKKKLSGSLVLKMIPVIAFMVIAGAMLGNIINLFFSALAGNDFTNPVADLFSGDNLMLTAVFVVLVGPFMEELFFRKILISKLSPYGQRLAILISAILFGLIHGNFMQMFYAFGLGLVLGYVYIETGSLKTTFIIHALFNLINGVLPTIALKNIDLNSLETIMKGSNVPIGLIVYLIWYLLEIILAIIGFIVLCGNWRNLKFKEAEKELPYNGRIRYSLLSLGMIVFMVGVTGFVIIQYFI